MAQIDEIFDKKEKFLHESLKVFDASIVKAQDKLLNEIISEYAVKFDIDESGNLKNTNNNIRLIAELDSIFNSLQNSLQNDALNKFANNILESTNINNTYFRMLGKSISKDVDLEGALKLVKQRLGINDKGVVKGSYLDTLGQSNQVKLTLKNYVSNAVTSNQALTDYIKGFRDLLLGNKKVDGALVRYFRQYAYDTFFQVDRISSKFHADNLGLKNFIYAGSLIETSREFCIKRAGKVFSVEETEDWKNDPDLIDQKTKDSYIPLIELGRYNCRHMIKWISNELAEIMRAKTLTVDSPQVRAVIKRAKESGPEIEKAAQEIAKKYNADVTKINYKSPESIVRKTNNELNGDISKLKDATRLTIVRSEPPPLIEIVNAVDDLPGESFIKIQTHEENTLGYSGNIVNVRTSNGLMAEIQVNTPEMIYAKEPKEFAINIIGADKWQEIHERTGVEGGLGHKYYEEWRVLDRVKDGAKMKEIERKSIKYYRNFVKK